MRFLFLGDLVGRSGRTVVLDRLPGLISDWKLDFVVVNGENAAGGFGVTEDILEATLEAGADVMTTGNHVWDQREALGFAGRYDAFLRPANYPQGTPGRGSGLFIARNGARIVVANIMGRVFMAPDLDDPFRCAADLVESSPLGEQADAVIVDFHAEATSEKQAMGHFLDGRASVVVGTHTHVPTADAQILVHGTAYQSDAGTAASSTAVMAVRDRCAGIVLANPVAAVVVTAARNKATTGSVQGRTRSRDEG